PSSTRCEVRSGSTTTSTRSRTTTCARSAATGRAGWSTSRSTSPSCETTETPIRSSARCAS
ncbi:MAG: hypothetical protein AVDCRST_MAG51-2409, partial [uncultured Ramlibacter sp.]